jgi:hypothetical protein
MLIRARRLSSRKIFEAAQRHHDPDLHEAAEFSGPGCTRLVSELI